MTDDAKQNLAPVEFREAVARNDVKAVEEFLKEGKDINGVDEAGHTLLCIAIMSGSNDVVRFLIDNGADVNRRSDSDTFPLMYAVCYKNTEIVRLLLERGADIDTKTSNNWTALTYAAIGEAKEDIMRLLIESGADPAAHGDGNGMSVLEIAEMWPSTGKAELVRNAPEIYREAKAARNAARNQARHLKVAGKQEQLKARAEKLKLKPGPRP
jgi:hypothetical protein